MSQAASALEATAVLRTLALLFVFCPAFAVSAHAQSIERVSLIESGVSNTVAGGGNRLFGGLGEYLISFDITDPSAPLKRSSVRIPGNVRIDHIALAGNLALLGTDRGLLIMDVSDPWNPVVMGEETSGDAYRVAASGNMAYVTFGAEGVRTIDISDPAHPVALGSTLVEGWPISIAVSGSHVVTAGYWRLCVVDVSNPTSPQQVGSIDAGGGGYGLAIQDSLAFVAGSGFTVVSLANPASPRVIGQYYEQWFTGESITVTGSTAYVGDGYAYIDAVDVSTPSAPVRVARIDDLGVHEICAIGNHLFTADGRSSYRAINVADPAAPLTESTVPFVLSPSSLQLVNGVLYLGEDARVSTIDMANPYQPAHLALEPCGDSNNSVFALDDRLYVGRSDWYPDSNGGGLTVFDASDPSHLEELAYLFSWDDAYEVWSDGQYVYFLGDRMGITFAIYDVSTPASPVELSARNVGYFAWNFEVSGEVALIAGTTNGMKIYDISDRANPSFLTAFTGSGNAQDVAVIGSYAFVADPGVGLIVVDIANPSQPTEVARLTGIGQPKHIAAHSPHVVLAGSHLRIVDVSDPAQPFSVATYVTGGSSEVTVDGQTIGTLVAPDRSVLVLRSDVLNPLSPVRDTPVPRISLAARPNPFNPSTTITFETPAAGRVDLAVFDVRGGHVFTISNQWMPAGEHTIAWDGRDSGGERVASGVYLCRLRAAGQEVTTKLVVLK